MTKLIVRHRRLPTISEDDDLRTNEGGQWVCVCCVRVCVLNWAEVKKRRMKLGAEDGRKSGVRDRLAVCEWVSERGRGEEGRLRDRKQRLRFFGDNLRNITNGNFQLFTRHSSAHSARSRLCFTAGVSTINEGIKQIPIDLFLSKWGIPRDWFCKRLRENGGQHVSSGR